jgi:hypothetical protein
LHVGNASGETLIVYDLLGKQLLVKKLDSDDASIDVSAFTAGVYVMQVAGRTLKVIKK